MLMLYAFLVVSALSIIFSLAMFAQKRLVRAVVSLTGAFICSAVAIFLMGQTLIAVLQLIIFVGGLSTYLIVSVATENRGAEYSSLPYLVIVAAVLFAGLTLLLNYLPATAGANSTSFLSIAQAGAVSDYAMLYLVVILLFGVAFGSMLVMKRFSRLIV